MTSPDASERRARPAPGPGTRVVHAGLPRAAQGEPPLPGPTLASAFHLMGDTRAAPFRYTRDGNPTWAAYERALAELEGGEVVLFASGMAAAAAVVLTVLRPGDVLVAPADGYPGVRAIAERHLAPRGVDVRLVPTVELGPDAVAGATLVWAESPANPGLDVCDLRELAAAAHDAGALLAVDNTVATPLDQQPLALGADLAVTSGTKALNGHGDLLIGHVATRDAARARALRDWRSDTGAIPGPMEAWLAHRSLPTLDLRLERQCANARAIAEALLGRDDVRGVRYPGLPGDPAHAVAARQMRRFGPLVAFELPGEREAQRFLAECALVVESTSFGGVHTQAERRGRWGTDAVPEGFIRLSAGVEETADLVADVTGALDALAPG